MSEKPWNNYKSSESTDLKYMHIVKKPEEYEERGLLHMAKKNLTGLTDKKIEELRNIAPMDFRTGAKKVES